MNGVRSTFLRKGYLLTALAAVVLLAASSGTALAQSVGFVKGSGEVAENSDDANTADTREGLAVIVEASGLVNEDGDRATDPSAVLGDVQLVITGDLQVYNSSNTEITTTGSIASLFAEKDRIVLSVIGTDDVDWKDDTNAQLQLQNTSSGVSVPIGTFKITVTDDDAAPTAKFTKSSISLTEDSQTEVGVSVTAAEKNPGEMSDEPQIKLMVSPANMAVVGAPASATCPEKNDDGYGTVAVAITHATALSARVTTDPEGVYGIALARTDASTSAGRTNTGSVTLTVEACEDSSGFKDPMVTVAFYDKSLASGDSGADGTIADGGSLSITVQSDEDTPVVSIVPMNLDIDEGDSDTFVVFADGPVGGEVMSVMLSMSGEALVSLSQNSNEIMADDDGMYKVELGTSANTRVTVSANADRYLEDGATKTATFTLESADGADIHDSEDSVMITVTGVPAVPALPLVGQLLLALFLMAGGSRLYRRRRG